MGIDLGHEANNGWLGLPMCSDVDSCADVEKKTSADSENIDAQRWRVRRGGCTKKSMNGLENGGDTENLTSLGEESTHLLLALDIYPFPSKTELARGGNSEHRVGCARYIL